MTQPNDLSQVVREMRETVKKRDVRHGYVYTEVVTEWADRIESLTPTPAEARGEVTDAPPCPVHLTEASRAWAVAWETSANHHIATLARQLAEAKAECSLLTHKVITCGVAARHPDPNLSRTGAYAGEWNSNQAEDVRALRTRAEQAEAQLAQATARLAAVEEAANAVIAQWESPQWKLEQPTARLIGNLRAALQPKEQK